jgi:3-methyl-2-oxobutanoate hydroxymethyltransferase
MADLPFACRIPDRMDATVDWVRQFHERTGSDLVKIEVAHDDVPLIEACAAARIPTVAHLGLLPQSVAPDEGYRAHGRDAVSARALIDDAKRFTEAGADMLLLEAVASEVAEEITRRSPVPVVGCVSGPGCDGTVVVLHDMIGLGGGHPPRSVKQYLNLSTLLGDAFAAYVADIHEGRFPTAEGIPHMKPGELDKLDMSGPGDF